MKWFVILYLPVLFISFFIFLRAWYRYLDLKESFRNMLPDVEKECVNAYYRYHLFYYRYNHLNKKIKNELVRRFETLAKYDREKADQLIRAEKRMWGSLMVMSVCLAIGLFAFFRSVIWK